jgi:hypothetical protein
VANKGVERDKVTQSVFSHSSRSGRPSPIHLESIKMALVGGGHSGAQMSTMYVLNAGNGGLTHPT